MQKITIRIDPSLCITAANCTGIAPNIFHINEEGFAEVMDAAGVPQGYEHTLEVSDADAELIQEAVDSCPARAISTSV
jgi:ferredoxin